jgi:hypothetical protein
VPDIHGSAELIEDALLFSRRDKRSGVAVDAFRRQLATSLGPYNDFTITVAQSANMGMEFCLTIIVSAPVPAKKTCMTNDFISL